MAIDFKGTGLLFGVVAAGTVLYGLARGHALCETLTAAVLLGIFVIAIAWIGKRVDARLKRK
jgi:uncharacterized membrane protein